MAWAKTFLQNTNPRFLGKWMMLLYSLSFQTNAQDLSIEFGPEGNIQITAKVEESNGFQLETSTNGYDWSSASDHWTNQKIFPVLSEDKPFALYRLKIWELLWDPIRLVIIGDSTIANFNVVFGHSGGWGQALPDIFSQDVTIANQAQPGISTKTFLNTPIFLHNLLTAKPDFVLIHFGFMDARSQRDHIRTTPEEFAANITTIVEKIRSNGGTPILCTPVTTLVFVGQTLVPSLSPHSENIRQVAGELSCYLIDLYDASFKRFQDLGPDATRAFKGGDKDPLHFNEAGAKEVAAMAAPLFPPFLKAYLLETHPSP